VITFASVLAQDGDKVVELTSGTRVAVSMNTAGIVLEELTGDCGQLERQLSFDFDPTLGDL
jgi:hypothetical protein